MKKTSKHHCELELTEAPASRLQNTSMFEAEKVLFFDAEKQKVHGVELHVSCPLLPRKRFI